MHICFNALDYPSSIRGSGVGNQVRLLARALVSEGHRVSVIDLAGKDLPEVSHEDGITIYRVRCSNWHWYLSKLPLLGRLLVLSVREIERSWAAYNCIREIHQREPIDVVEGTETGMLFLPLLMPHLPSIIRLHGEPYTFVKHTPDVPLPLDLRLSRFLQRLALRRARLLVSPSFRHAHEIRQEMGKGGPPLEVVPNTIPTELFGLASTAKNAAEPILEKSNKWIDGPIVLFVGRLERGKGVLLLLHAASRVLADVPNAHFVLAGGRHPTLSEKDLEDRLRQLPEGKRVHLLGHVPWERLLHWYDTAALCVLPSYYETFGLAALEAMAFGLPVVALSAGALPEVVEDQVTGLLVPPSDATALAEAIKRLLNDPDLTHRLGENGRRSAQRFLVQKHLRDNLELFCWASHGKSAMQGGALEYLFPRWGTVSRPCPRHRPQVSREGGRPAVSGLARSGDRARTESAMQGGAFEHVFFSPHLDDVALSCGGLVAAAIGRQEKVRAITIFAGCAERSMASTFARHLHEKWGLRDSPTDRLEEDRRAFLRLGVAKVEHWEYLDAAYRRNESGAPLYCTYEELKGKPSAPDGHLIEQLVPRVRQSLAAAGVPCRVYFPLGLGRHIDHQLVFQVGLHLRAEGWDIRFYEDWPYAEAYEPSDMVFGWMSETVDISIAAKHAAILEHRSQIPGLGGSADALQTRLTRYALQVGKGRPCERYWFITPTRAEKIVENANGWQSEPLRPKCQPGGLIGIRRIFSRVRGVQLAELLPRGSGECLLLEGTDDERAAIEVQGYSCRGLAGAEARGTVAPASAAAFVAWRRMKSSAAEQLIRDACSVLSPGGVIVGLVSQAETTTLKEFLGRQGFRDVEFRPDLSSWRGISAWFRSYFGANVGFVARKSAVGARCTLDF